MLFCILSCPFSVTFCVSQALWKNICLDISESTLKLKWPNILGIVFKLWYLICVQEFKWCCHCCLVSVLFLILTTAWKPSPSHLVQKTRSLGHSCLIKFCLLQLGSHFPLKAFPGCSVMIWVLSLTPWFLADLYIIALITQRPNKLLTSLVLALDLRAGLYFHFLI